MAWLEDIQLLDQGFNVQVVLVGAGAFCPLKIEDRIGEYSLLSPERVVVYPLKSKHPVTTLYTGVALVFGKKVVVSTASYRLSDSIHVISQQVETNSPINVLLFNTGVLPFVIEQGTKVAKLCFGQTIQVDLYLR